MFEFTRFRFHKSSDILFITFWRYVIASYNLPNPTRIAQVYKQIPANIDNFSKSFFYSGQTFFPSILKKLFVNYLFILSALNYVQLINPNFDINQTLTSKELFMQFFIVALKTYKTILFKIMKILFLTEKFSQIFSKYHRNLAEQKPLVQSCLKFNISHYADISRNYS